MFLSLICLSAITILMRGSVYQRPPYVLPLLQDYSTLVPPNNAKEWMYTTRIIFSASSNLKNVFAQRNLNVLISLYIVNLNNTALSSLLCIAQTAL